MNSSENELLILADIHGNAEALRAVLDEVGDSPETVIVAGDVVGYGPRPEECIDLLRERDARVVMGNHDAAMVGELPREWFNHHARSALDWQEQRLNSELKDWLKNLPERLVVEEMEVVHGSPDSPLEEYLMNLDDFDRALHSTEQEALVVGHTHVPAVVMRDRGTMVPHAGGDLPMSWLNLDRPFVINPGSVGQPRDRDPRASFARYDADQDRIRFGRVSYDVETVQQQILNGEYSPYLAERLSEGR